MLCAKFGWYWPYSSEEEDKQYNKIYDKDNGNDDTQPTNFDQKSDFKKIEHSRNYL